MKVQSSTFETACAFREKKLKKLYSINCTLFVFTAGHGAMVQSHGFVNKQRPYEESINFPMLICYSATFGNKGKKNDMLIGTPDLMPNLLGLCGLPKPAKVEGEDKLAIMKGKAKDKTDAVLIASYHHFGQWPARQGVKEYREVRTKQYPYVKDLSGPWLLFDNQKDPFQLNNLMNNKKYEKVQNELENELSDILKKNKDEFRPGIE